MTRAARQIQGEQPAPAHPPNEKTVMMWIPPEITIHQLHNWIKINNIPHGMIARSIGMSKCTFRDMLYAAKIGEMVPIKWRGALAAAAIFSGIPGLFEIKLVDLKVAQDLARGFNAAGLPKNMRTLADSKAIGYASKLADVLLRVTVPIEGVPHLAALKDKREVSHDVPSSAQATDAQGPSPAVP